MRDYMINEARSRQAFGRLTWLVRLIKNWRNRQTLKHLQTFSDYQLRDIGVERHNLRILCALPLDADLEWHSEQSVMMKSKDFDGHKTFLALPSLGRAISIIRFLQINQRGTLAAYSR